MLSRRGFLRLGLFLPSAAALGVIHQRTAAYGTENWLRWMGRGAWQRLAAAPAAVSLVACSSYQADVRAALADGLARLDLPSVAGKRVVLKPNLVDHPAARPEASTHPAVLDAALAAFRARGAAELIVADGSANRRDTGAVAEEAGLGEVIRRHGAEFVDLNYDELQEVPLAGRYTRQRSLFLPRTILAADVVVSLPRMKCHHWTRVSLAMKNMFGIVPGIRYGWPKNLLHHLGINEMVVELYHTVPPHLAIVDGIVGMEGDGPLFGTPRPTGVLALGQDLVAVDATCARLMGIDPRSVGYLQLAGWAGLGHLEEDRIQVRGPALADLRVPYRPAPVF